MNNKAATAKLLSKKIKKNRCQAKQTKQRFFG
jgi:hypothetical protein